MKQFNLFRYEQFIEIQIKTIFYLNAELFENLTHVATQDKKNDKKNDKADHVTLAYQISKPQTEFSGVFFFFFFIGVFK